MRRHFQSSGALVNFVKEDLCRCLSLVIDGNGFISITKCNNHHQSTHFLLWFGWVFVVFYVCFCFSHGFLSLFFFLKVFLFCLFGFRFLFSFVGGYNLVVSNVLSSRCVFEVLLEFLSLIISAKIFI